jgi:hypothetical protein
MSRRGIEKALAYGTLVVLAIYIPVENVGVVAGRLAQSA